MNSHSRISSVSAVARAPKVAIAMKPVEAAGSAQTSGLKAVLRQTKYVISENPITGFAFGLFILLAVAAICEQYGAGAETPVMAVLVRHRSTGA